MVNQRKKTSAKVLSVILTLMMVVTLVPVALIAETENVAADTKWTDGVTGGEIYFDESTGTITGYGSKVTKVVIPKEINGVRVKTIGFGAFSCCDSLESVTIPNSVTSIDDYAFCDCDSLTSVTIPNETVKKSL